MIDAPKGLRHKEDDDPPSFRLLTEEPWIEPKEMLGVKASCKETKD